jgi:hypothetical protein
MQRELAGAARKLNRAEHATVAVEQRERSLRERREAPAVA